MHTVNIHQAKTHFSKLIDAALSGKETTIAKAGKPAAKLTPFTKQKPKRRFGLMKGKIQIASDFDAPLPKKILNRFKK